MFYHFFIKQFIFSVWLSRWHIRTIYFSAGRFVKLSFHSSPFSFLRCRQVSRWTSTATPSKVLPTLIRRIWLWHVIRICCLSATSAELFKVMTYTSIRKSLWETCTVLQNNDTYSQNVKKVICNQVCTIFEYNIFDMITTKAHGSFQTRIVFKHG